METAIQARGVDLNAITNDDIYNMGLSDLDLDRHMHHRRQQYLNESHKKTIFTQIQNTEIDNMGIPIQLGISQINRVMDDLKTNAANDSETNRFLIMRMKEIVTNLASLFKINEEPDNMIKMIIRDFTTDMRTELGKYKDINVNDEVKKVNTAVQDIRLNADKIIVYAKENNNYQQEQTEQLNDDVSTLNTYNDYLRKMAEKHELVSMEEKVPDLVQADNVVHPEVNLDMTVSESEPVHDKIETGRVFTVTYPSYFTNEMPKKVRFDEPTTESLVAEMNKTFENIKHDLKLCSDKLKDIDVEDIKHDIKLCSDKLKDPDVVDEAILDNSRHSRTRLGGLGGYKSSLSKIIKEAKSQQSPYSLYTKSLLDNKAKARNFSYDDFDLKADIGGDDDI